ncbi:conserved hypothetical protein [Leishmania braziliensis MHOM/BR/75/M2904]|uniref:Uncharacterized protein n=2 Tax=Leishmania braziliensis TaxID=5660 RepID=A4H429_LEIBR|nr:conserved hypothetical protein [Leishmania braziliensis MHOM/BR/75/M2904]KAI5689084.1 hypothetical protein MNV84_00506 [Leishmania braziliensis]CAJ2466199.1 unnamed protein product [Leishmania braziliensis]CAJ2466802.1 unnamed protein product [Leishmania braziliensis]CAM41593.1 conserved hypothetical protein [Leishmania braziliensis MHOM/BR/75/M2904]SYZ62686.1 hypothetical_protein [Leishmania braziliensis MHOM/BR/75/M2904]
MPPKFTHPRLVHHVSLFTRIKAWWLGIENPEVLSRYGERGVVRTAWIEWRGTLAICAGGFVLFVGRQQSKRANDILENIELNRQRYYQRDFKPTYVPGAPGGVYDGVTGYSYRDGPSGLMINADKKLVSDESRAERGERLAKTEVTPEMVTHARNLLHSRRYEGTPEV